MNIIAKTKDMPREEWLRCRAQGIGGSDVSVLAGINPFRSVYQLWLEKTGRDSPEQADSEHAHFGTLLEPVVRKEFTERTGIKVRRRNMLLQSTEHPFMIADLDGVISHNGEKAVFEAKTASAYKQDVWEKEVPAPYILQVQHYMAVTGMERAYIAALVGGNRFYYHVVERDDGMIAKIIGMEEHFWQVNVLGGKEPVPDGSQATTDYFSRRFGESNGGTVRLPEEALAACEEYERLSAQLKEVGEKKAAAANLLKSYLKEAETGIVGERKVTWKQIGKNTFDSSRLQQERPDIYEGYLRHSTYRRLTVA